MDGKVERYNKIYMDNPDMWATGPGVARNWIAYNFILKYIHDPETFLDIGCGNGHTIEYFKKYWPDTEYYGVDLSDVAIGFARERVPEANFICGDFYDLYVETPPKDVVVVMGVAEHFEKLVDGLRRLKEYGNLIYLEVPNCLLVGELNGSTNNEEGFRETYLGGTQMEWHLKHRSWEERIRLAGLEILENSVGSSSYLFVWILK